jgi:hypothetical protein
MHRIGNKQLPSGRGRLDGLWRNIAELAAGKDIRIRKVKAHRSFKQAQLQGDLHHWAGNEQADAAAKRACGPDAPAKADVARQFLAKVGTAKAVLERATAVHAARRAEEKIYGCERLAR